MHTPATHMLLLQSPPCAHASPSAFFGLLSVFVFWVASAVAPIEFKVGDCLSCHNMICVSNKMIDESLAFE